MDEGSVSPLETAAPAPVPAPTPAPADEAAEEAPDRSRSVLQVVGSVVAPTSLLTALLYYFGWAHAYWFFHYFGIDITLLGLTTQDYMMRSVDALFVPLTVVLSAGLFLLWANANVAPRLFSGPQAQRRRRVSAIAVGLVGVVLFMVGLAGIFVDSLVESYHLAFPLSLGSGALLVFYASRLQARPQGAAARGRMRSNALLEATVAFLLVALSMFWAATNYAASVGEGRARQFAREVVDRPEATVYSKERLLLAGRGVEEAVCADQAGGYRFRYDGLRLILRSAEQYFLLPERWSPSDGVAIVVPQSESVRLQFTAPAADRNRRSGTATLGC